MLFLCSYLARPLLDASLAADLSIIVMHHGVGGWGTGGMGSKVACRSWVDRDSDDEGRTVEKWSLELVEGVNR